MMKRDNTSHYSGLSSLEEIKFEKMRLRLREKILESRISMDMEQIKEKFSLASVASSFARSFVLPKVSDLIGSILKRFETEE